MSSRQNTCQKSFSPLSRVARPGFTLVHLLVLVALITFLIALLIPMVHRTRSHDGLLVCKDNLRRLGVVLRQYADSNGGALPVSPTLENPHLGLVQAILPSISHGERSIFYCPDAKEPIFNQKNLEAGNIGYFYYCAQYVSEDESLSQFLTTGLTWPRILNRLSDPRSWVMSDSWFSGLPTAHAGYRKGVNYLMLDGSVDFVTDSPRQSFH